MIAFFGNPKEKKPGKSADKPKETRSLEGAKQEIMDIFDAIDNGRVADPKNNKGTLQTAQFLNQYEFSLAREKLNLASAAAVQMVGAEGKINRDQVHVFHNYVDETIRALDQYIARDIPSDGNIERHKKVNRVDYEAGKPLMEFKKGSGPQEIDRQKNAVAEAIKAELLKAKKIGNETPGLSEASYGLRELLAVKQKMEWKKAHPGEKTEKLPTVEGYARLRNTLIEATVESREVKVAETALVQRPGESTEDYIKRKGALYEAAKLETAHRFSSFVTEGLFRVQVLINERGLLKRFAGETAGSGAATEILAKWNNNNAPQFFDNRGNMNPESVKEFDADMKFAIDTVQAISKPGVVPALAEPSKGNRAFWIMEELQFLRDTVQEAKRRQQVIDPEKSIQRNEVKFGNMINAADYNLGISSDAVNPEHIFTPGANLPSVVKSAKTPGLPEGNTSRTA